MISASKRVQSTVSVLAKKKVKHIVFSPGSRNAPLVLSLVNDKRFKCVSIVDERSAAFYAMGLALEINEPVLICCTSGSAALNYSSALSEAYYQHIPLVAVTTDRPPEWINHGEGQSINQTEVFKNFTTSNFTIPIGEEEEDIWLTERLINEAINDANKQQLPVHINFPFREPLYNIVNKGKDAAKVFKEIKTETILADSTLEELVSEFENSKKVLILCGQQKKNENLNYILNELSRLSNVSIFTECTSNLYGRLFIPCIDRVITNLDIKDKNYQPDLLITIGGAIVSKKIKKYLRQSNCKKHWSINEFEKTEDTYLKLTTIIPITPNLFFRLLFPRLNKQRESNYKNNWLSRHLLTNDSHDLQMLTTPWSDLKTFDIIYNTLPINCNLHLGNSSPVRYMQLFNQINEITYYGNRGVSGIDGSTSTACGIASCSNKLNIIISGDLSFVYDINALWNNHLTENIRIIVINNSGGGIFRIIPGPKETNALEDFFEVGNETNIKSLVKGYDINYYKAEDENSLEDQLSVFYNPQVNNRPAILEIFTPNTINAEVLKNYFKNLT